MSLKQIIQESMDKNPLGVKEALEAELQARVRLALEAKMSESDDEDDEDEDEDEDDMDESFDLSDLTLEELEDFIESDEFDSLDEDTQESVIDFYEALTPEQKRARELNRVEPRKGGGDSISGRKGSDRDYTHTRVRGMKGAERTKETSGLTKHGKAKMSKIGKHGYAYDNSSSRAFKPNAQTSLAQTKMINRKIHRKDGMMGGNYGKSKLPESTEE